MTKYFAQKTEIDGIMFDSKVEGAFYEHLMERKAAGDYLEVKNHQKFTLQDGYQLDGYRKQRPITYEADFVGITTDGDVIVYDVKGGPTTPEFKLKKKLFEAKFGQPIIEVRRQKGQWVMKN